MSDVDSSPAVVNGIIYVGFYDGDVYALNASDGTKVWSYTTGNHVESSPAVVGDMVFVGSDDYNVYGLNLTTGGKIWSYTTGAFVESSPTVLDNVVFVGSEDRNVYALNATTGHASLELHNQWNRRLFPCRCRRRSLRGFRQVLCLERYKWRSRVELRNWRQRGNSCCC